VLTVFITGIGPVSPALRSGEATPADALYRAESPATATIGGISASVEFLGMTPGFAGLAQANVRIPDGAATGPEIPLVIRSGDQASNTTVVSIR
jgi:uncharacterized protein (TIGR03437 family)